MNTENPDQAPLQRNNRPFSGYKKIPLLVACCFLLLILLCSGIYMLLRHHEENRQYAALEYEASVITGGLEHILEHCSATFRLLEGWRNTTAQFDSRHFTDFLQPFLGQSCAFDALAWVPRVSLQERETFEKRLQQEAIPGQRISELDNAGNFQRAGERQEYFPVFFLTPSAGREKALGFDLATEPVRREALETARKTGKIEASGAVKHILERGKQLSFLLLYPLHHGNTKTEAAPPPETLAGFFLAVFRSQRVKSPFDTCSCFLVGCFS